MTLPTRRDPDRAPADDAPPEAMPASSRASALAWRRLFEDPADAARLARDCLARVGAGAPDAAEMHVVVALAAWLCGHRDGDPDAAGQARCLAEATGCARDRALCDELDAVALRMQGRPRDALAALQRAHGRAPVTRPPLDRFIHHCSQALTRRALGATGDALTHLQRALDAAQWLDTPGPQLVARCALGGCLFELFQFDAARTLLSEALVSARARGAVHADWLGTCHLVYTADALGDRETCQRELPHLMRLRESMPEPLRQSSVLPIAIGLACLGQPTRAQALLDASPRTGAGSLQAWVRARLLVARDRDDDALSLMDRQLAHDVDAPDAYRLRLLRLAADCRKRGGDTVAALRHAEAAHALYERLLQCHVSPRADDGDRPHPGARALSPRESQVATMILDGHSSVSIGLNLGLSIPTVKSHRRNLYAKLGVSTQAQLMSVFLQHRARA